MYEVAGVQLLPFRNSVHTEFAERVNEHKAGLERLLVNTGFYFSYYIDLSVS